MRLLKWNMLLALVFINTAFASSHGSEGGGGGDAFEMRVDIIRSDLLEWIKKGGAQNLKLPYYISLEEYREKMVTFLRPKYVKVIFLRRHSPLWREILTRVNGMPKTCVGVFRGRKTKRTPYIFCNISRFAKTSEADQYRLIHHEYAGLASLERNDGEASDYIISKQITNYLRPEQVLRLYIPPKRPLPPKIETSYLLKNPQHPGSGLLFSYTSDENGVCKSLGYQKAAKDSHRSSSDQTYTVEVDESGKVIRGANDVPLILQIICINSTGIPGPDKSYYIEEPYYSTNPPFKLSSRSSEDGACKVLGYERAAKGSATSRYFPNARARVVRVNEHGWAISGKNEEDIVKIICLNKVYQKKLEAIHDIESPTHPVSKVPFASGSDPDGVCKVLGHVRALKDSAKSSLHYMNTLKVDHKGEIVSGPNSKSISRVACLDTL